MSILDHTSHDFSPHEHGYETNDFGEIVGLEHAELEKTAPEPYFEPFVEQADTGDFPSLRADVSPVSTSGTDPKVGRESTTGTVPAPDNHEEHSTLLIAGLLPIGCLWIGITVDSLFDSVALTASIVAVFATLTLGVLVASALHDSE